MLNIDRLLNGAEQSLSRIERHRSARNLATFAGTILAVQQHQHSDIVLTADQDSRLDKVLDKAAEIAKEWNSTHDRPNCL